MHRSGPAAHEGGFVQVKTRIYFRIDAVRPPRRDPSPLGLTIMTADSIRAKLRSLAEKIPGYSGYAAAEKRRAEDRELRKLLAERLSECKAALSEAMKRLRRNNQLDLLGILDGLNMELDIAQQKTAAAFEGYSGWFDQNAIDERKLAEVVELDESLISIVDRIRQSLPSHVDSVEDINESGELLATYIERFDRRDRILHS